MLKKLGDFEMGRKRYQFRAARFAERELKRDQIQT